jgi:hypothetical protein
VIVVVVMPSIVKETELTTVLAELPPPDPELPPADCEDDASDVDDVADVEDVADVDDAADDDDVAVDADVAAAALVDAIALIDMKTSPEAVAGAATIARPILPFNAADVRSRRRRRGKFDCRVFPRPRPATNRRATRCSFFPPVPGIRGASTEARLPGRSSRLTSV